MIDPGAEAVFVPGDPPRTGRLFLWNAESAERGHLGEVGEVELVLPAGTVVRRRTVAGNLVPLTDALAELVTLPLTPNLSLSLAAWSNAAKAGAGLVASGRLLPGCSAAGFDAWRVAPLGRTDQELLHAIADAFPPRGHALPIAGARPLRIHSASWLVRQFWDAIADVLVRSPSAVRTVSSPAFASQDPVPVRHLAEWLATADSASAAGCQPGLRLELPDGNDGSFRAVVQLRSVADPSLMMDAADIWAAPSSMVRHFGDAAETELLLALRRAARIWAPAERVLDQSAPAAVELDDDEALDLLGPAADDLAAAGFEVLWPAELTAGDLTLRAVVGTPTPAAVTGPTFTLDALVEFRWELAMGGEALSEDELDLLAEAKRPLVRLRGRWVLADRSLIDRLERRQRRRVRAGDALAAALTGSITIDGEKIEADVEGPFADLATRLTSLGRAHDATEPEGLHATLRPYQRRGLAWLDEICGLGLGGCLADDMGLGKTIQLIGLHLKREQRRRERDEQGGPTLVVCPASLLGNWERELRRFAPGVPVRRYHGNGRTLDDVGAGEVVLVTYGVVRGDGDELGAVAWDLVVADEAQHAKNPLSRTARALRRLPATARVALTGTPVENRLSDLWAILDWTTPGLLGPLDSFRRDVAIPVERYQDELATQRLARVVRPFLLRRRKADPDIAPELPPKTETDVVVPLTAEQATLYEATVREAMAEIEASDGMARRGLVLRLLTGLKQICNHPAQYLRQKGPIHGRSGKLRAVDELLDIILAEGASVLVFTQYVAMARVLETHLAANGVPSLFLHGGVEPRKRDEMVERFQRGDVPVFLLSLKAGGTGLNLTTATHVIHYDRWWNPAVEDQATDRAYRIGQDRPVQVHRLVTEGTLEERIASLLASKRDLAERVVGAGEAWISELSDAALREMVSLRPAWPERRDGSDG